MMKSGNPATEPAVETAFDRRHDLDALRALAMLLGIGLHGGLAYITVPFWPIHDDQTHYIFDLFFSAIHGFRMPLFFVISGFFTAMLWRKRGLKSLIKHRTKRIFLPMVVFLIPISLLGLVVFSGIGALEKSRNSETSVRDTFWMAAKDNHLDTLKRHLESQADINEKDPQHQIPALNWAALNGSLDAAKILIDQGAEIDVRSGDKSTPLSHASFMGRSEIVALLIEHGANVNSVNQYQSTPLDNTNANWGIVEWVAGGLQLKIDKKSLKDGRKVVVKLLRENGGKLKNELKLKAGGAIDSIGGKSDDAGGMASISSAYFSFPLFHQLQIFGHLWFLWFLCILIVLFSVYAVIADRLNWTGPPRWLFLSPFLLLWLVPLTAVFQSFHGLSIPSFGPETSVGVFPFPHIVLLYAVYFFFGAFYFDCDDREGKLGSYWWITLPFALLVVFPLGMGLVYEPDSDWVTDWIPVSAIRPAAVVTQVLFAWLMIFGLMGLFRKFCSKHNKAVRYVSDSAYFLYLLHIPLVFVAQYLVKYLDLSAFVKFAIVCISLTVVLLLIYEFMVRYTILGTLLNGKRTRTGVKPAKADGEENLVLGDK